MSVTCAAAFHPKVWTCATAPRKTMFPELSLLTGLPVPAPPFAQRATTIPDANPLAKFCVNDAQRAAVGPASGDVIARLRAGVTCRDVLQIDRAGTAA